METLSICPFFSPSVSIKYVRWIIVKQSNKRA
uniref:Uncharacterized protein n=1 Tax=Geladintestivirus 1 TaxID=3233133 RepID=A0AAU8MIJ4_9CAUD